MIPAILKLRQTHDRLMVVLFGLRKQNNTNVHSYQNAMQHENIQRSQDDLLTACWSIVEYQHKGGWMLARVTKDVLQKQQQCRVVNRMRRTVPALQHDHTISPALYSIHPPISHSTPAASTCCTSTPNQISGMYELNTICRTEVPTVSYIPPYFIPQQHFH